MSQKDGAATKEPSSAPWNWFHPILIILLMLASALWVARDYRHYWNDSRGQWTSFYHDRHAHCAYAMDMGDALQRGDIVGLVNVWQRNIVWPPVHGLVAALAMLATDFDHRTVVFPALLGWWMVLVFGPLAARGVIENPTAGWIAATMTWLLTAPSPAHRAYATDCLLEGLGAGLTTLCLFLYTVAKNHPNRWQSWLGLAIGLTILFFEKSNYWLIVVAGISLAELISTMISTHRRSLLPTILRPVASIVCSELRQPLTWIGLLLAIAAVAIGLRGPTSFDWQGNSISLYPPGTIVLLAYVCFFVRFLSVVGRNELLRAAISGPAFSAILAGHVMPIAVSFLVPKRLMMNLWFLSPANRGEESARPIVEAAQLYLHYIIQDYHPSLPLAVLTAFLLGWAMVRLRAIRPAGWGILAVLVLAVTLLLLHPNQKARFLHSWLAIVWIVGGIGIGTISSIRWPNRLLKNGTGPEPGPSRSTEIAPRQVPSSPFQQAAMIARLGFISTAVVLATIGLFQSTPATRMMVDQQPGNSLLELSDWYLSEFQPDDSVAILSTQPDINFFKWTFRERFGKRNRLEKDSWLWWPITDSKLIAEGFQAWLARTKVNHVVVIDVPPESSQFRSVQHPYASYSLLPELMANQRQFEKQQQTTLDGCRASIWRRRTDWVRSSEPSRH
jgi:hypothetical protein